MAEKESYVKKERSDKDLDEPERTLSTGTASSSRWERMNPTRDCGEANRHCL